MKRIGLLKAVLIVSARAGILELPTLAATRSGSNGT